MKKKEFIVLLLGAILGIASKYVFELELVCAVYFVVVMLFYLIYLLKCLPEKFHPTDKGLLGHVWLFRLVCVLIIIYMIGDVMTFFEFSCYKYVARVGYFGCFILFGGSLLCIVFCKRERNRAFYLCIRCICVLCLSASFIPEYQYSYSVTYGGERLLRERKLDGKVCVETLYMDSVGSYRTTVTNEDTVIVIYYESYPEKIISHVDTFYVSEE